MQNMSNNMWNNIQNMYTNMCKQYAGFHDIAQYCMQYANMQNNMHDMKNMQTSFPICRICTAHFADDDEAPRLIFVPLQDCPTQWPADRVAIQAEAAGPAPPPDSRAGPGGSLAGATAVSQWAWQHNDFRTQPTVQMPHSRSSANRVTITVTTLLYAIISVS